MSRTVEYHRKPTPSHIRETIQAYRRQQPDVTSLATFSIGGLCSSSSWPVKRSFQGISPALSSSAAADTEASGWEQQEEFEQQKRVKKQEAHPVSLELEMYREIESIKQELACMGEAEFEQRLRDKEREVAELKQQLEATQREQEMATEEFNARHRAAQEELRRQEEAREMLIRRNGELDAELCELQKELAKLEQALGKDSFETFRITFFGFVALQKEHQLLSRFSSTPLPN